ncbi:TetR/AcrR family transcriptional regulator [Bacillus sp. CLL-7-23]|uniref:TetR/AcrR family transcriptional regulator n=1 Tax=Bacillus changyiensis TaxID=3004103 RepID=A0ABT4X770_9BACI|nr:TetR/AcrR family transcriptional regulator [Bacillus changyiensis]MDA7028119.1 TetR/AcrR family transcriptional regulator [Bacillus changyiensis]
MKNEEQTKIRKPKQARSIKMKEKILNAAFQLFCEKGYYKTTTNEIAQRAQVSIGSLYSYFKDKDTIFMEILNRYHNQFQTTKNKIIDTLNLFNGENREGLHALIKILIQLHEESKELNRELNVLSYYNPTIAKIIQEQKEQTLQDVVHFFMQFKNDLKIDDLEATAIVIFDMISATVDRIVFEKNEVDRERLINAAIEIIYKFFKE